MKSTTEVTDPVVKDATLQLRRVAIDTYRENVAYLHRQCEVYRAEGFQALAKVEITADSRRIQAVLNVVDDDALVAPGELGLSEAQSPVWSLASMAAVAKKACRAAIWELPGESSRPDRSGQTASD